MSYLDSFHWISTELPEMRLWNQSPTPSLLWVTTSTLKLKRSMPECSSMRSPKIHLVIYLLWHRHDRGWHILEHSKLLHWVCPDLLREAIPKLFALTGPPWLGLESSVCLLQHAHPLKYGLGLGLGLVWWAVTDTVVRGFSTLLLQSPFPGMRMAGLYLDWLRIIISQISIKHSLRILPMQAVFGLSPTAGFLPTTLHSSCSEKNPIPRAVVTHKLPCWL